MLDKLKEADGIFCSNEPSTFGMLLALKQNNLAGSKKFVGFDMSQGLMEGLRKGVHPESFGIGRGKLVGKGE